MEREKEWDLLNNLNDQELFMDRKIQKKSPELSLQLVISHRGVVSLLLKHARGVYSKILCMGCTPRRVGLLTHFQIYCVFIKIRWILTFVHFVVELIQLKWNVHSIMKCNFNNVFIDRTIGQDYLSLELWFLQNPCKLMPSMTGQLKFILD